MTSEVEIDLKFPTLTQILQDIAARNIQAVVPLLQNLSQDEQQLQEIYSRLDLLNTWIGLHHNILQRLESKKYLGFRHFATSTQYPIILGQLMGILAKTPSQAVTCVVSTCGIEKLDTIINEIKKKALESYNLILHYLFNKTPSAFKAHSPFVGRTN